MILRLTQKYKVVDLGKLVNYDFYHLDHYHFGASWPAFDKANPDIYLNNPPQVFYPNSKDWGFIQHNIKVIPCLKNRENIEETSINLSRFNRFGFKFLLFSTGAQIIWDNFILSTRLVWKFLGRWYHRARVAWETVRGQPLTSWPSLLMSLWIQKQDRQKQQ